MGFGDCPDQQLRLSSGNVALSDRGSGLAANRSLTIGLVKQPGAEVRLFAVIEGKAPTMPRDLSSGNPQVTAETGTSLRMREALIGRACKTNCGKLR